MKVSREEGICDFLLKMRHSFSFLIYLNPNLVVFTVSTAKFIHYQKLHVMNMIRNEEELWDI